MSTFIESILSLIKNSQTNWGQKSQMVDSDWNIATVDAISDAVVTQESEHHYTHLWKMFRVSILSTVTNPTPKYCQFKTGNVYTHLKQKEFIDGTDSLTCELFEAPTLTDGTTAVASVNDNRNSSNVSANILYSDPTNVTSDGTLIDKDYLPASAISPTARTASTLEQILKPNTNYIFKVTKVAAGTATFFGKLHWYES